MDKSIPEFCYYAAMQANGIHSKLPIKCQIFGRNIYTSLDDRIDVNIADIGKLIRSDDNTHFSFSSYNRKEVEKWIEGARCAITVMHNHFWGKF